MRWRCGVHHVPHRVDRVIRFGFVVTDEVHHDVGGPIIRTLGSRRCQRIPPEVLDVRDMAGIGGKLPHQIAIEPVRVPTEWLVAFQHDRYRVIGIKLTEHLTNALDRLNRCGVAGAHRYRVCFSDHFQLRYGEIDKGGEAQPEQDDHHRKPADQPRQNGRQ
ncbi:Uncharacterised protein [Mycobacterium tuberculosis]|uniref:Uncharacterized protein n=1 Tax=Mycobacterium tuberculosis TaxID=1773 RepID=A0A655A1Y6_MYCTX|nr:Uncharacterised protein [Mycobacterium tuberculosis]CFE52154.1 Uncharacterised protein [Mycobacterium tuberculosis]CFR72951.1 Uncharacterised protein [Mycobacterium tuberculosis]CKR68065.1 Uncharacterised protein [Mycobacterium tuberculosis]CKS19031.1 Uncharacterised protein [Mycobacterium tuberculosis]